MKIKFKSQDLPSALVAGVFSMLLGQLCAYFFTGYSLPIRALAAGLGAGVGVWLVIKFWRVHPPKQ
jgi:ABC-type cobalamin transport system permease subunit